jgi:hypothetical protein
MSLVTLDAVSFESGGIILIVCTVCVSLPPVITSGIMIRSVGRYKRRGMRDRQH